MELKLTKEEYRSLIDTLGFTAELERIIRDASDAVAVMNCFRGKEKEHMRTEAQISLKDRKSIITIYELQPPGKHGLSDQNTYYHQGIPAAYQNYRQVKQAYPHQEVDIAFHEYTYYELLRNRGD